MRIGTRVLCGAVLLLPAIALKAQVNNSAFVGASVIWGQKVTSTIGPGASTQFWFATDGRAGRSYCVEAGNFEGAVPATGTYGDHILFTTLTVYQNNGTSVVVANTNGADEPFGFGMSRACWVAPFSDTYRIKLTPSVVAVPATAQTVELRFVETTLYCPWFFIAGDYNAFSLLRNSSVSTLSNVVITWRGLNGTVAGTTTVATVPGNGGIVVNARDFVNPAVFSNGTIEVAYVGSLHQLSGSTTTLSGTTGIGFDAAFAARPTW